MSKSNETGYFDVNRWVVPIMFSLGLPRIIAALIIGTIGAPVTAQAQLGLMTDEIEETCTARWKDDYAMRNHCFEEQVEAKQKYVAALDVLRPGSQVSGIFSSCSDKWASGRGEVDWVMTVHCTEEQMDALDKIRDRQKGKALKLCDSPGVKCDE